jgi:Mg-chelatase subunit ChlD
VRRLKLSVGWAIVSAAVVGLAASPHGRQAPQSPDQVDEPGFRFRSGVELVNVTATVSDANGRFVPGLQQADFVVYEDDQLQAVTHFSAERVPVSLGIAVDASGSMAGDKIQAAQAALDRFLYELLDRRDEIFLYRFGNVPTLLQGWTTDRQLLTRALGRLAPSGGTAMYDTVAEAVPLAQAGQNRKKALLVISDGNDTASGTGATAVRQLIRGSDVLVYAIGIDGENGRTPLRPVSPPRIPIPIPPPFPGGIGGLGGRGGGRPQPPPIGGGTGTWARGSRNDDRVNAAALKEMTDDSGGRTEIIRDPRDLDPATAGIADELSKQYDLGYPSAGKRDGRWHSIRVEVRNKSYRVRARRGYVAS